MTYQFPEASLAFLRDLADNNTKEWFQANKKRYEADLKKPARALADAINGELADISPDHMTVPGKAISRINRDIRFSKDKTPYKTEIWGGYHNGTKPKGHAAGFYFGVGPNGVGVGAGLWMTPKDKIAGLRHYIAANGDELQAILSALSDDYGEPQGAKLKRVPKGFDPDHPAGELLKHKGLYVKRDLGLDIATSAELVPTIGGCFRQMMPLVAFLDRALGNG